MSLGRVRFPRRAAVFVALVALAGVSAVSFAPSAPAAARALHVTPSSGLGNQVVKVSWEGFNPTTGSGSSTVSILQCSAAPVTLGDCFTGDPYPAQAEGNRLTGTTADDGTGSVLFEVRPAANLPALACSATKPCSILAYELDGHPPPPGELPATAVVAPLGFAKSQADCPPVTDFDVRADGAASAAQLFYRWAAQRCDGADPLVLDYTETSSNAGRENFLRDLVDVGVTSDPARAEELHEFPEHQPFVYAPVDLNAVVVAINMVDPFTGRRIENLVLTPRLVARFVTDSDVTSFFGDPELRRLNPGVRFPTYGLSDALLRGPERNADTRLVTTWMTKRPDSVKFLAGHDTFGVRINGSYLGYHYPRDTFENVAQSSTFLPRQGERPVSLRLFYGVRPNGATAERADEVGFLGILDLPTARRLGLPTARIVNGAGKAVGPTDAAIRAGFRQMKVTEQGTLEADLETKDAAAYPLVKVDYGMIPTQPADEKLRTDLQSLLRFAAGDGQEDLPPGYIALPESLRNQARQVADDLGASAPTTTTTPTTPTTAKPATAPVPTTPTTTAAVASSGDDGGGGSTTYDSSGSAVDAGSGEGGGSGSGSGASVAARAAVPAARRTAVVLGVGQSRLLIPALLVLGAFAFVGWAGTGGRPRRRRVTPPEANP